MVVEENIYFHLILEIILINTYSGGAERHTPRYVAASLIGYLFPMVFLIKSRTVPLGLT